MARKRPRGTSEGRLQSLWRRAVLRVWLYDPFTGEGDHDRLQCHHIIFRRYWFTRHDWRNGIPLTAESHARAHGLGGDILIYSVLTDAHREYLEAANRIRKADYLASHGMSEAEFLAHRRDELERVIEEGASARDAREFEGVL